MHKTVSVCIPTCNRPSYFEEALRSVLEQESPPSEVIVGDDSENRETEKIVDKYRKKKNAIHYERHDPSLGQAKNVHSLIQKARGEYVMVLHDDDRLVEGALGKMMESVQDDPEVVAAFGKQQVIGPEGNVNWKATRNLNRAFDRTSEHEGEQDSSLVSAITQQFPNDGYVVRTETAKKVGYNHSGMSDACDFAFGVELAQAVEGKFFYTDVYTSQYRLSEQSIVRGEGNPDGAFHSFEYVRSLPQSIRESPKVDQWLRKRAPVAILRAAQNGYPKEGLRRYFGEYHRSKILTLGGMRRLALLLKSWVSNSQV